MTLKKLIKKITTTIAIGAISLTVTFPAIPASTAEALGIGSAINIGIGAYSMSKQKSEIKKQLEYYNNTNEGSEEVFEMLKEKYGVNYDYALNDRVDTLMRNLTNAVAQVDPSINEKHYKYFVNMSNEINAFCSFGHVMSINTGILKAFPNDDELAIVVGHEMGHGQKNHTYKGVLKSINKQMVASLGTAAIGAGVLGQIVGNVALNQSIAHGTKSSEKEADTLAFEYITHSVYNPGASAAVWQRFLDLYGDNSQNALGSLFAPSDHPNNAARRDTYVKQLYEYSGKHVNAKKGVVKVNNQDFMTPVATSDMSGAERSYFVMGNLAAAYNKGFNKESAYAQDDTVMLGSQPIVTVVYGDESAQILADRLNSIK